MRLGQKPFALAKLPARIQRAFQIIALGKSPQPMPRAREAFRQRRSRTPRPARTLAPASISKNKQGGQRPIARVAAAARVGDHHQRRKKQHGPQTQQPVHKHRHHRLGFLVVGFARGVKRLDHVAAGRAEQEGIKKLRHKGNAGRAAPAAEEALHPQHQAPAGHAQKDGQLIRTPANRPRPADAPGAASAKAPAGRCVHASCHCSSRRNCVQSRPNCVAALPPRIDEYGLKYPRAAGPRKAPPANPRARQLSIPSFLTPDLA